MRFGVKLHVPIYDAVVILQALVGSCNVPGWQLETADQQFGCPLA